MQDLLPEVSRFLSGQPLRMFIGGQWTEAQSKKTFETLDPGEGSVIAAVAAGDKADVDRAVGAARAAFQTSGWATLPANDRAVRLHRLADLIERHASVLAQIESLDVGKPRSAGAGL